MIKKTSTLFLRLAIIALGVIALAICVFVVPVLSREMTSFINMNYLHPLMMGALYASALAFFAALFQSFRLLSLIDKRQSFSAHSVEALRNIKVCGGVIATLFTLLMPIIFLFAEKDDAPGLIIVGAAFVGAALTVTAFAALLEKLIADAIEIKTENDLTV